MPTEDRSQRGGEAAPAESTRVVRERLVCIAGVLMR